MTYPKSRLKPGIIAVSVILVAVASFFVFKTISEEDARPNGQGTQQGQTSPETVKQTEIDRQDFKYQKPVDWAELSTEFLDSESAVSGIGLASMPTTRFTIAVEPTSSSPTNDTDRKNATLDTLKRLKNFELIGTDDTKVNGATGQRFTYKFGDDAKTKQELIIVAHKQNVFLLKFTSADSAFDKQKPEFDKIVAEFKFK